MMKLLLVSSSRTHGTGFLDHCEEAIRAHFSDSVRLLFVPYALADHDAYAHLVRTRLGEMGCRVRSIHQAADPAEAVREADGLFIGGGNTFRLLKTLYDLALVQAIRERVREGMPYMGSSAGTNMACPTIRTSNDMPIVQPPSFEALGLIPFQINPHFVDASPDSTHQGETRETRLREFLEENAGPVVGIREGSWLEVNGDTATLRGSNGAKMFAREKEPFELTTDQPFSLNDLG